MSNVPKTKENLKKCLCMKCPSYTFACKMQSMPGNAILMMSDVGKKIHAEAMYCAYEKSHCIVDERGCICSTCELYKEYELGNGYYCSTEGGK